MCAVFFSDYAFWRAHKKTTTTATERAPETKKRSRCASLPSPSHLCCLPLILPHFTFSLCVCVWGGVMLYVGTTRAHINANRRANTAFSSCVLAFFHFFSLFTLLSVCSCFPYRTYVGMPTRSVARHPNTFGNVAVHLPVTLFFLLFLCLSLHDIRHKTKEKAMRLLHK